MAGHAQPYRPRRFGSAAVGDHTLEVGVGLKLRGVGGLRPAVQGSFHLLHGQVGAFDNAQFDGRTTAGAASRAASTCSMARLAPLTMRSLMGAPPRAQRAMAQMV